jgi:hypothetical protein
VSERWKQVERRVASYLGGVRVPVSGRHQRGYAPDVEHSQLSIEVKDRQKGGIPKWLKDAMAQAIASLKNESQIPVSILHEKQMRIEDCYVLLTLRDLKRLLEEAE